MKIKTLFQNQLRKDDTASVDAKQTIRKYINDDKTLFQINIKILT